jgi:uncharacterized protein (TIGR02246 family)
MADKIHEAALKWAEAIQSRDPENVLKLYHPEGSLWGTLSPVLRHGYPAISEYFDKFLQKEQLKCDFQDGVIREHQEFAFYSGSYTFTWKDSDKKVVVPARFSFVYRKVGDQWLIMEHHSSLYPELPFKIGKYSSPDR